jgi:hypothetical protein
MGQTLVTIDPRQTSAGEIGGDAIRRDQPRLLRRDQRIARVVQAGGIEIGPRFLAAVRAERSNIGAISFGADDRRTRLDLQRQTGECDETSRRDRSDSDGVNCLDHDTRPCSQPCAVYRIERPDRASGCFLSVDEFRAGSARFTMMGITIRLFFITI